MNSTSLHCFPRRHFLYRTAGLTLAIRTAHADAVFTPTEINHVFLRVADTKKSVAFYEKLFGPPSRGLGTGAVLFAFGISELGMGAIQGRPVGIDHFCIGVRYFQLEAVSNKLKQQQLKPESMYADDEIYFGDPDGILVQLSEAGYRNPRARLLTKSTAPAEPLFRPLLLHHIALRIENLERTTVFYERLLGPAQRQKDRPLAGIRLPSSQVLGWGTDGVSAIGVDHFCISIEGYEPNAVAERLKKAGISSERLYRPDQVFIRDPDGLLVQLAGPDGGVPRPE